MQETSINKKPTFTSIPVMNAIAKNYEEKKFKEYALKRELLHSALESVRPNALSNTQIENMVCDLKEITVCLESATSAIDHFLKNMESNFNSRQSANEFCLRFQYALMLCNHLYSDSESSESSESESSESEILLSVSESESSSRSDSDTFSSWHTAETSTEASS